MNRFLKTASALFLASQLGACSIDTVEEQKPNVLLILTDDQGWGDLSFNGNQHLQTPNLDGLFEQSTVLSNFYVNPVCAPSRASLLTGRYNLRTGTSWVTRGTENMRTEEVTMAEIFKDEGYKTGLFGKWHNGAHYPQDPNGQGFDEFWGFCAGHWSNYFDTELQHNQEMTPTKGYITDVLTDKAMVFMEENKEKPFLCFVPYNTPHTPFQVADKYFDKYKDIDFGKGEEGNKQIAAVYGMIDNMDENIGRMLQKMEDLDLDENTIVIFLTDNGPQQYRYNGAFRGRKTDVLEGGVRVPFAIKWQNQIQSQKIMQFSAHIDILPTLLDLCKIEKPQYLKLDGISLSKSIMGEKNKESDRILFDIMTNQDVVSDYKGTAIQAPYKWVIEHGKKSLYNIKHDPSEQSNLIDSLNEKGKQLELAYLNWFDDVTKNGFDPFLIPVGYNQAPVVQLQAHEARLVGDLKYKHSVHGWAHDWVINWKNTTDRIEWDIDVIEDSSFEIFLNYSCSEDQIGSGLMVKANGQELRTTISEAFIPTQIDSPDRASREQEAYEQTWGKLSLGKIQLPKGKHTISLSATKIGKTEVGELKNITMSKQVGNLVKI
ncbi:arylsulfatase [Sediminitomix flava]|uniref:Arylsulfatase A n=1 Tax=Sediminitomix flava TaxID=379075 RepID=A0A315ZHC3_SEDFL|nr:arylsulfatase [Sediminitomix flava]PWJ44593.1 arylsulfatase A [Sediminitomix flava]